MLAILFWIWKALLLFVAVVSPGSGYDTSTQILLTQYAASSPPNSWLTHALNRVVSRLTRWDAIYFASSSTRGHVYEQEWAFSWVLARLTSTIVGVVPFPNAISPIVQHAVVGIVISHISHFLAVMALFRLTYEILPLNPFPKRQIAFTAACLHIVSPAGLFLSSSNAESAFALFNFLGMLAYVFAVHQRRTPGLKSAFTTAFWTIGSSICFAQAAVLRSNGLLSGLIFAWDAVQSLPDLPAVLRTPDRMIRLAATLLGGILLGITFAAPQVVAYFEYCTAGNTRPWCDRLIPSIYTWVQDHYWNVGFLRYWTLSNLPLFLLAAPSICILVSTGMVALQGRVLDSPSQTHGRQGQSKATMATTPNDRLFDDIMARLALPQVVLALSALTNFHVQTINRISSGYPLWYIVFALAMYHGKAISTHTVMHYLHYNAQWIVRTMVMYAVIQGGLFASFLPPA